ncbi:hypothetical protein ANRL3_01357 [Anaerolineae bacterium]|nr:hypothetical protein ANRL3_01357 [Anaerolineae bacterium]
MTIWLIDQDSRTYCLRDSFVASFFVHGTYSDLHRLCQRIHAARLPVQMRRTERYDLFQHREIELLEIAVPDPARFPVMVQTIRRFNPRLTFYNCTVPVAQFWFYARGLFPFARVEVETKDDFSIRVIELGDSRWEFDYALPPFKVMTLQLEGEGGNPNHGARPRPIEMHCEGNTHFLQDDDPHEFLLRLQELLLRYDPDLILSAYGDSFILPRVLEMSRRYKIPLAFNRDQSHPIQFKPARSYFSYGRIIFRSASHTLFGRLHLDLHDAFLFGD